MRRAVHMAASLIAGFAVVWLAAAFIELDWLAPLRSEDGRLMLVWFGAGFSALIAVFSGKSE